MTDQPLLLRAARWLEFYAADLQQSYTLSNNTWPDHDDEHREAHRDHDELLKTAKALRAVHRGESDALVDCTDI